MAREEKVTHHTIPDSFVPIHWDYRFIEIINEIAVDKEKAACDTAI